MFFPRSRTAASSWPGRPSGSSYCQATAGQMPALPRAVGGSLDHAHHSSDGSGHSWRDRHRTMIGQEQFGRGNKANATVGRAPDAEALSSSRARADQEPLWFKPPAQQPAGGVAPAETRAHQM